jgi:hypothetical protein
MDPKKREEFRSKLAQYDNSKLIVPELKTLRASGLRCWYIGKITFVRFCSGINRRNLGGSSEASPIIITLDSWREKNQK